MIRTRLQGDTPFFPNMLNNGAVEVCLKEDVDSALFEKDKEIAGLQSTNVQLASSCVMLNKLLDTREEEVKTLKQKLEDVQASAYAESVDAGMRERRLKRALYKACANWMINRQCAMSCFHLEVRAKKFDKAIDKCRVKAEEYK